ncbi:hypothetical protein, partial [Caulobacter sp. 602-1]|uniref:hypothetical protein n=1 Tax=Caulobacter sp. 602-1 TaxID=2492472 RepID=UPI001F1E1739
MNAAAHVATSPQLIPSVIISPTLRKASNHEHNSTAEAHRRLDGEVMKWKLVALPAAVACVLP